MSMFAVESSCHRLQLFPMDDVRMFDRRKMVPPFASCQNEIPEMLREHLLPLLKCHRADRMHRVRTLMTS